MAAWESISKDEQEEISSFESAKHLADMGIRKLPSSYILPQDERPSFTDICHDEQCLPVIDLSDWDGARRDQVLEIIAHACTNYGFFQVINHGIPMSLLSNVMRVTSLFFDLPLEDKKKYMSKDFTKPVRYGTSFNQVRDSVFCWRDFLKLDCHPLPNVIHLWPSNPSEYREIVASYAEKVRLLAGKLMEAIMETLSLPPQYMKKEFEDGTQIMVVNYYPPCPEPDLTLGIPPHSDYGCITILLQDGVGGLQVQRQGKWKSIKPFPGSFVVNIGDHLEILSNGRYKSAMHRVVLNSERSRISVATLHSFQLEAKISPALQLVDEEHPKMYTETDFGSFLKLMTSSDVKEKTFLKSLRLF